MRSATLVLALLIATGSPSTATWRGSSLQSSDRSSDPTPLYRVSFERGDAVAGLNSTPAVQLPFKCTSDGTIFATFVGSVPANSGLLPPLIPPLQFVSIRPPEQGVVFRLDPGASITFWNRREVEALALDKVNDKNYSFDDRVLAAGDDVSSLLQSYFERLGSMVEATGRP